MSHAYNLSIQEAEAGRVAEFWTHHPCLMVKVDLGGNFS